VKKGAASASPINVSENRDAMKLEVECYSGQKADERPLRFRMDGRQYVVKDILDQWYEPESISYRVRADDGNLYIIRHQTSIPNGTWELVSFRQGRE
jgi:hypothetical protein